jgi:CheY-like chemotaxis protein
VLEASSGREALELMIQNPTDILVTDVDMPLMDGMELTSRVRMDPRLRHIRVIMITGMEEDEVRQKAKSVGVDTFIHKPVNESELLRQLGGEE